ncbi:uncharacterized protein [Montipora capricornis]|uniref:uncharacterized protein isoform X4 n=1 Tax=Montipora capricornis TaxID=246305 RepID=UPI0035F1E750
MFLSRFPFRLIRQSWTESYSTVSVKEVEALKKKAFFYSVHLRNNDILNMPAPGYPLSSATLNVSKGPCIEFAKLAPSLFEFLETVTTNDRRYDGPKWKAFEVLENALQVLTSEETPLGLTSELMATLNGLRLNTMKSNTEEAVNLAIVNLILKHLTRACFILNKSHSKVFEPCKQMFTQRLVLGHRNAWYGELDMLIADMPIFPFIRGEARSKVALLGEKCGVDPLFDEDEEGSDVEEEGLKKNIGQNRSLFGSYFSQAFATAVTFSYVYHYKLSAKTNSACPSFLPTVQVSPRGYQIFIYDCLQDVMFANNFFWTRSTLIYLWAILHHRLFFPAQLDSNLGNRVTKFGYGNNRYGCPLFENRHELLFGQSVGWQDFIKAEPVYGRMCYY